MKDVYEELLRLRAAGTPAALATVVSVQGSVPGSESLKMLVSREGRVAGTVGGGCVEAEVISAAREVIEAEKPRLVEFTLTEEETGEEGLVCGGTVKIFVEPVVSPTCYLFGGGHVSLSVSKVAGLAGFRVVVIDDREAFANRERFPHADDCVCGEFLEVARRLPIGPGSYIVIVTRGHRHDRDILGWAVTTPARYIGMIGSRRKVLGTFRDLVAAGTDPAALERVKAPIGADIGAVTQEEIAVAIVAEMIAVRRAGFKRPKAGPRRPHALLLEQVEVRQP